MSRVLQCSFIVRVIHQPTERRFVVRDLRTGETREFSNWLELQQYLERYQKTHLR